VHDKIFCRAIEQIKRQGNKEDVFHTRVASDVVMSSGNVTLHPFASGAAAMLRACPERAERVEWETSLNISVLTELTTTEIVRDSSTSVGMTK
jgi:hypothetical protein